MYNYNLSIQLIICIYTLIKTYLHLQLGRTPELFVFFITGIQLNKENIQTNIIITVTDDFSLNFFNLIEDD